MAGAGEPEAGEPVGEATGGDDDLDAAYAEMVAGIGRLTELVRDAPVGHERAEGYRYLLRFLAAGIRVCVELDDTETPELGRSIEHRMTWGLDNPDTLYGYSRLDGAGTYRITGHRGSARHLELQVNTGHQGDGDFAGWRAVSATNGDELSVREDDTIDVWLSADPPPAGVDHPHGGERPDRPDWLRLDDTASFLLVRQYFSDWTREQSAELVIERLDRPLPPAPLDATTMSVRLALLTQWLEVGARCWDSLSRGLMGGEPGDVQPFLPPAEASGLKGQAYGMGAWRCAPDEAVVLTLDPPTCRMWGVSLCDRWWQSIDFGERQSSLNDSQARPDETAPERGPAGRTTMVISHDDPGIANWLDPGGNTGGTLAVRYLFADTLPPLRTRTVPRSDLEAELPPGVARVTPDERRVVLATRRRAVTRRFHRP